MSNNSSNNFLKTELFQTISSDNFMDFIMENQNFNEQEQIILIMSHLCYFLEKHKLFKYIHLNLVCVLSKEHENPEINYEFQYKRKLFSSKRDFYSFPQKEITSYLNFPFQFTCYMKFINQYLENNFKKTTPKGTAVLQNFYPKISITKENNKTFNLTDEILKHKDFQFILFNLFVPEQNNSKIKTQKI